MNTRSKSRLARWGIVGVAGLGIIACSNPNSRQEKRAPETAAREQSAQAPQQLGARSSQATQTEQKFLGQEVTIPGQTQIETSKNVTERHQIPTIEERTLKADINRMTADDFIALGMNREAADNVVRYRQQVGSFHSVDELKDIPGMDLSWYNRLEDRLAVS